MPRSLARALCLSLVAAALAGCTEAPAPEAATAPGSGGSGSAGAAVVVPAVEAPPGGGPGATGPALEPFPVDIQGKLGPFAGVVGLSGDVTGWERWFPLDIPGTVVQGNLTLSWDRGNLGAEVLWLGFGPTEPMGNGGSRLKEGYAEADGASPVVVAFEGRSWTGGAYAVAIGWPAPQVHGEQPFTVQGTVWVAPEAPAAPGA